MASYIFDRLLQQGLRSGQVAGLSKASREWFRSQAAQVSRVSPNALVNPDESVDQPTGKVSNNKFATQIFPGGLYTFMYNPKYKFSLPYYDKFPLIFPVDAGRGFFTGLNMHYLPHKYRARLMDVLYDYVGSDEITDRNAYGMALAAVSRAAKLRYFAPTFKRYLTNNVQSRFLEISPKEWEIALFLPTERFIGAGADIVWTDTTKKVRR